MASHDKPETCPPSEFSWGQGMHPNPNIDYDQGQINPPGPRNQNAMDVLRDKQAGMRSNTMSDSETLDEMLYAKGNPDRYGGHPPLVQQGPGEPLPKEDLREPIVIFERED